MARLTIKLSFRPKIKLIRSTKHKRSQNFTNNANNYIKNTKVLSLYLVF